MSKSQSKNKRPNKYYPEPDFALEQAYLEEALLKHNVANYELPKWIVGADIRWSWGFDNSPELLLTLDNPYENTLGVDGWEPRYTYVPEAKAYVAIHPSGDMCEIHYHKPLLASTVHRKHNRHHRDAIEEEVWVTPRSEGYGGREFPIIMEDGRKAVLIGPWHGGVPKSMPFLNISYRNINPVEKYPEMYYFGLKFHTRIWLKAATQFFPNERIIRLMHGDKHYHPDAFTFWKPHRDKEE